MNNEATIKQFAAQFTMPVVITTHGHKAEFVLKEVCQAKLEQNLLDYLHDLKIIAEGKIPGEVRVICKIPAKNVLAIEFYDDPDAVMPCTWFFISIKEEH